MRDEKVYQTIRSGSSLKRYSLREKGYSPVFSNLSLLTKNSWQDRLIFFSDFCTRRAKRSRRREDRARTNFPSWWVRRGGNRPRRHALWMSCLPRKISFDSLPRLISLSRHRRDWISPLPDSSDDKSSRPRCRSALQPRSPRKHANSVS